ncbi:hypothetical protein K469DRAFT_756094 [Zopfia rhizophila CBS 207.26]|uniref:EF-hand domain-containing protein n=1 Tax=Zopfia rhizophila CBS 207.26 TaxID=1314779 RepID=A0A6A6D842_9PEZI|nr:hypothetical protein K469DRAFT_756094 [Zopfia rhizophila CBS 207.26]
MLFKYLLPAAALLATAACMSFSTYGNDNCAGQNKIRTGVIGPKEGCQKRAPDEKGVAVMVEDGNVADESMYAVFFKSEDCDPSGMINKTELGCSTRHGIAPAGYGSWEIWDMCEGQAGCSL